MALLDFWKRKAKGDAFSGIGPLSQYKMYFAFGVVDRQGPALYVLAGQKSDMYMATLRFSLLRCHPLASGVLRSWDINADDVADGIDLIIGQVAQMGLGMPMLFMMSGAFTRNSYIDVFSRLSAGQAYGMEFYRKAVADGGMTIALNDGLLKGTARLSDDQPMGFERAREYVLHKIEQMTYFGESMFFFKTYTEYASHGRREKGMKGIPCTEEQLRSLLQTLA